MKYPLETFALAKFPCGVYLVVLYPFGIGFMAASFVLEISFFIFLWFACFAFACNDNWESWLERTVLGNVFKYPYEFRVVVVGIC